MEVIIQLGKFLIIHIHPLFGPLHNLLQLLELFRRTILGGLPDQLYLNRLSKAIKLMRTRLFEGKDIGQWEVALIVIRMIDNNSIAGTEP